MNQAYVQIAFAVGVGLICFFGPPLILGVISAGNQGRLARQIDEDEARLRRVVVKLRERGKTTIANRLESSGKRLMELDEFKELCVSTRDRCKQRNHAALAAKLESAYGLKG